MWNLVELDVLGSKGLGETKLMQIYERDHQTLGYY